MNEGETYEGRSREIGGWKLQRVSIRYADGTEKLVSEDGTIQFSFDDVAHKPTSIQGINTLIELPRLYYGYVVVCEYIKSDATYVHVANEGTGLSSNFIGGELDEGEDVFIEQGASYQVKEPKSFLGWVFE